MPERKKSHDKNSLTIQVQATFYKSIKMEIPIKANIAASMGTTIIHYTNYFSQCIFSTPALFTECGFVFLECEWKT